MFPFKICCTQSEAEADLAIEAGAYAIGLVGPMPNGVGPIEDPRIAEIASHVRRRDGRKPWTVLLTSRTDGAAIADHVERTGADTVQIVDAPAAGVYAHLRRAMPALRLIQVIHVENECAIEEAAEAAEHVDALLLDSGKPSASIRTLGGTGDVHDWSISRRIVEISRLPVFLAGGLNPSNVDAAIEEVRPFGVDICSGLRGKGEGCPLDAAKLGAFAAALSSAGKRA
jgi:phosphoribosylanthranilate isomerase